MKKIATILFISIFLIASMSTDTAEKTDDTITNIDDGNQSNVTIINDTYILDKDNGMAKTDGKIYTDESVKPKITMTGKPSCTVCARNHCSYTWRTRTYLNYCPHCHHWNCLGNKHKSGAIHENEITCFRCDSDFCVNCGKTKYSWSNVYLLKP